MFISFIVSTAWLGTSLRFCTPRQRWSTGVYGEKISERRANDEPAERWSDGPCQGWASYSRPSVGPKSADISVVGADGVRRLRQDLQLRDEGAARQAQPSRDVPLVLVEKDVGTGKVRRRRGNVRNPGDAEPLLTCTCLQKLLGPQAPEPSRFRRARVHFAQARHCPARCLRQ